MPQAETTTTSKRDESGQLAAPAGMEVGGEEPWPSEEVARVYRVWLGRLQQATVLLGVPATEEARRAHDERVWRYLLWLGRHSDVDESLSSEGASEVVLARYVEQLRVVEGLGETEIEGELEILRDMHRRMRHGGNRLESGHPHREGAPSYVRVLRWPPDPERRDAVQRRRVIIAADEAVKRGELTRRERAALGVLLSLSNDYCSEPVYPALATVGREAGGFAARTAGEWLAALHRKGWVKKLHRCRRVVDDQGVRLEGTSNLWRVDIPDHLRQERHAAEDEARRQTQKEEQAKRGGKSGRYTPPSEKPRDGQDVAGPGVNQRERNEAHRRGLGCSECAGTGFVEVARDEVTRCTRCDGTGVRAPP